MILTGRKLLKLLAVLAAPFALVQLGGCDRVGSVLGLTGQVAQVAPQPIDQQRLRVSLPQLNTQATLAPVARRQDYTIWQTLDGITLTLRHGLLTATRGLGNDLMSADVANNLAMLSGTMGSKYYPHIRSYLDGEDRTLFRAYQCRQSSQRESRIMIDGTSHLLRQIEESCVSPDHKFSNVYWLDRGGVVLKSRQWVSSKAEYIETESVVR